MILNTHPNDRKDMVKAISELTGLEGTHSRRAQRRSEGRRRETEHACGVCAG